MLFPIIYMGEKEGGGEGAWKYTPPMTTAAIVAMASCKRDMLLAHSKISSWNRLLEEQNKKAK